MYCDEAMLSYTAYVRKAVQIGLGYYWMALVPCVRLSVKPLASVVEGKNTATRRRGILANHTCISGPDEQTTQRIQPESRIRIRLRETRRGRGVEKADFAREVIARATSSAGLAQDSWQSLRRLSGLFLRLRHADRKKTLDWLRGRIGGGERTECTPRPLLAVVGRAD